MSFITVHITNLDPVKDKLARLALKMHDFAPAMEKIGVELGLYFSGQVFASQGAVLGSQWQSLSASTEAQKQKYYPGRGILERSGHLRQSFTHEVSPMSVLISNDAKTASGQSLFAIHQLGTSGGRGRGHNIPAREMIGINEPVKSIIAEIIETDIRAKIEAM